MKKLTLAFLFASPYFCHAQDFKQIDELISNYQFEKALAVLATSSDTTDVRVPLQRGYCYYRLGNFKNAIQCYSKALQLDSINRTALIQLGQLYARHNRFSEAKMCYERLILMDSTSSYYFKQYAALATSVNDIPLAIELYTQTLLLNPNDLEAYSLFGNILLDAEDYGKLDSLMVKGLGQDSLYSAF